MANPNCPIPNNINPLSPTGFRLTINKVPDVTYFCQEANIPSMNLDPIQVGTPFSTSYVPGEILGFGELTVNFIIDEDMKNYKAIYDWMIGLGFPRDYDQFKNYVQNNQTMGIPNFGENMGNYSDGTLEILGSNNLPVRSIVLVNLYPTSLGSLNFQSNVDDIQYLTGSASFRYSYFEIA